jgi:hypothetical protein
MGVDFALNANGSTTQTISAGRQAVYPLLLTAATGVPGAVALTCTGAPAYATCVVNPASVALGGTSTVTVTVATNVASLQGPGERGAWSRSWLAGLLPVGLLAAVRRRRRLFALTVMGCLLGVVGCGASRLIPATNSSTGGGSPTPSGTYNLVVAGASAGLTRTVGLTLVVQ